MKVLVTGAGGQTGDAVVSSLSQAGFEVRALVHREELRDNAMRAGANEVVVGDAANAQTMTQAVSGVSAAYVICPSFSPKEEDMVRQVITCAEDTGSCGYIVYHSVLHSNLTDLRHHARKLASEELLANSGLRYAVMQPAILMQNLARSLGQARETGQVPQRFYTVEGRSLAMVDLRDVAMAAARVMSDMRSFSGGTYELVGQNLTAADVRGAFTEAAGREVTLSYVSDEAFARSFPDRLKNRRMIDEMQDMFHHYSEAGFPGSTTMLRCLLGREPTRLPEVLARSG